MRQENVLDANIHARGQDGLCSRCGSGQTLDEVDPCQKQCPQDPVTADARRTRSCGEPPRNVVLRMALVTLDEVDPCAVFSPESSGDEECAPHCMGELSRR